MTRVVQCIKLNIQSEGLDKPPYPGALGQKIFENISKQAWQLWLAQQTILMNENKLSMIKAEHRQFLEQEMGKFLFGNTPG